MLKLYKSSAGSGKTFTLVKEYLRLCLPAPDKYKAVVAITFTNAAAAEMKERILQKLEGLIENTEPDLRNALISEGLSEKEVCNASKLLENILRDYSRFNVSTIDSFFQRILRAFGKELGLPMDFEIQLETMEAIDFAVDTFLQRSNTNPELHELLLEFINEKVSEGRSWNIRGDLYSIAKELLADSTFMMKEPELAAMKKFISGLKQGIRDFESGMDEIGNKALKIISESGFKTLDFKYGATGPANYFNNILKNKKDYAPKARISSAIHKPDDWGTKTSPNYQALVTLGERSLAPLAIQAINLYDERHTVYNTAREVLKNIYTFSVYGEMQKLLQEYKAANDMVLISDFNPVLARHLQKDQMDFIYSKIGARYEHFLIDEFQDTSTLQWMNLKPLIENAVAQGADCLIVGDSKQAIYRWRGGEVELIETHVQERDFMHVTEKFTLSSNFRSRIEVVQFNNRFFNEALKLFPVDFNASELLEKIFVDVAQKPAKTHPTAGKTEVSFFEKEGISKELFIEKASEKLIYTITKLNAEGYNPRDITILIRNNSESEIIADLLNKNKLEFISPEALFLDKSPAIRLLLSVFHFLDNPSNELAKAELLFIYSEYFNDGVETDTALLLRSFADENTFNSTLPAEFINSLPFIIHLPIYTITNEIVKMFGLSEKYDTYIQRFRQVVYEFSKDNKLGIHSFLEWWEEGKYKIIMPEDLNAIRIMTLHKSKGLEFPVVIMPFVNWEFTSRTGSIMWVSSNAEPYSDFEKLPVQFSPKLADTKFSEEYARENAMVAIDNLNLLYVAFTRARERLYVFSEKMKKVNELKSVTALLNLVFKDELDNGKDSITEWM